jgi:hypothetical protein
MSPELTGRVHSQLLGFHTRWIRYRWGDQEDEVQPVGKYSYPAIIRYFSSKPSRAWVRGMYIFYCPLSTRSCSEQPHLLFKILWRIMISLFCFQWYFLPFPPCIGATANMPCSMRATIWLTIILDVFYWACIAPTGQKEYRTLELRAPRIDSSGRSKILSKDKTYIVWDTTPGLHMDVLLQMILVFKGG